MILVDGYSPVAILIPINDVGGRYADFMTSEAALHVPVGSELFFQSSANVAWNLNTCWRAALESERTHHVRFSHAWILGDDHVFSPTLLTSLLDRHVDVVAPLVAKRSPPFSPIVFPDRVGVRYRTAAWKEIPFAYLWPVACVASAGMLLSRAAMDALGDPWFVPGPTIGTESVGWDMYLCDRLRERGILIHCDTAQVMGHTAAITYTPRHQDGVWGLDAHLGNHEVLHFQF